ncbi:MAG TPA: YceI family protein [Polyangiaceae bacterium]|jgi:polyisoprenoid-binding protein YceI|nr:YceI family protein [Polyangiaceae bacterium]
MTTYTVDYSHSDVGFSVRHMVFAKVRGHFTKWTAEVAIDPDTGKSSVKVEIDAATIDTREPQRDAHLRSPDFLEAEKYPKITYKSSKIEKAGDKKYVVTGDLTIRGVTKPVKLDVEELGGGKDPWGNQRVAYAAKARVDRGDYGLKWNQALETGGVLVGEHIDIEIDIEAIAKP